MATLLAHALQCSHGAEEDGTFEDGGCRGILTGPLMGSDTLIVSSVKSHIADKDALERSVLFQTLAGCRWCQQQLRV